MRVSIYLSSASWDLRTSSSLKPGADIAFTGLFVVVVVVGGRGYWGTRAGLF